MRILSFSHDAGLFGAQRSLLTLLAGLRQRGHEVTLVCPADGPLTAAATAEKVPVRVVPFPYPSSRPRRALAFLATYPAAAGRIRRLVDALRPDVVHLNTAACIAPGAALRRSGVPLVWHIRETVPFLPAVDALLARWSRGVLFNCRFIAEQWPRIGSRRPTAVVYNGLDAPAVEPAAAAAVRRAHGWGPDDVVVLFAGHLLPHKDPEALLDAVAAGREQGLPMRGCVAGDGPLRASLARRIEQDPRLSGAVDLVGFVEGIDTLIAASDVVVCPSKVEPFPRIVLEAMAQGKPVVATEVGGVAELVEDGVTGFLVPPGNHAALATALGSVAAGPPMRTRLGEEARRVQRTRFSEDAYVAGAEAFLLSLPQPPRR